MKYKKSEGTASTFLITSIIGVTILITIGVYVNSLSREYSVDSITYFDGYEDTYQNITLVGNTYVEGYDLDQNSTNTDITRTEDGLFFKAFEIIRKTPRLIKGVGMGINQLSDDLGIPPQFTTLLITIFAIVLITLIIKIIRGFNNV